MDCLVMNSFNNIYKNKVVFVTGHTGFKGTWLTLWLLQLGAKVVGVSKDIPTEPSMFRELNIASKIDHHILDIRNKAELSALMIKSKPDLVFHLAAQAIVSESYANPLDTLSTNVIGFSNILDILRGFTHNCSAVMVTSDKCYENVEWIWGYKESDHLGGKDIYSASKGCAEVVFNGYFHSFFKNHPTVRIATGRAGNVIGGGDWAQDRIVADCMRAWSKNDSVEIRSPNSTRPWQHVLEPLSGYLTLAAALVTDEKFNGQQFNFGPKSEQNRTVKNLLENLSVFWNLKNDGFLETGNIPFHEAKLLKLNCDKALFYLKWESTLPYSECVKFVSEWYYDFYNSKKDMFNYTLQQIEKYTQIARNKNLIWANDDAC